MKKLFTASLVSIGFGFGCAHKTTAPATAKAVPPACSLTNSTQCKPVAAAAPQAALTPFYESVSPSALPETKDFGSAEPFSLQANKGDNADRVIEFDIPVVVNEDVERWISYFQSSGRKYYSNWLSRSGKYIPMMQTILKEHGLPQDLVYLSMIESGFRPVALSHAKAMGPWQFMKGTSKMYGLRTNWWIDERRDPEKSTVAAAQHLKDLYDQFSHWYLAAAGYNAGAGKITRAMQRYSTEDFWEMTQFRYLKPETKNYVPKLLAAAIIAKQPEAYGFTGVVYEEPIQYTKVHVPEQVELRAVAAALEIDPVVVEELNPELLRGVTPSDYPDYQLKLPVGLQDRFLEKYAEIKAASAETMVRHVVRRSETLGSIARNYGVTTQTIMSVNNLRSNRLKPGQELAIPAKAFRNSSSGAERKARPMPEASNQRFHQVREGDTLWDISKRYNVSVSQLKSWNDMERSAIQPGSRIKVRAAAVEPVRAPRASNSASWTTHRVRRGDTLWSIARQHGVTVEQLQDWNNLSARGALYSGKSLKVRTGSL